MHGGLQNRQMHSALLVVTRSLVGVEQMLSLEEKRRFGWPPYKQYHYSRLQ